MIRVYVAGKYNDGNVIDVLDNMRRGIAVSVEALKAGYACYSPWLDFQWGLLEKLPLETYKANSIEWLKVSDCVLLVPGWERSNGAREEVRIAEELEMPVFESLQELREAVDENGWKELRIEDEQGSV